ncbi:GMC oxidoreductase-like protein [Lasiosphaeria ovina]|uniref:GMC oxidoreductase-like protein n=1 Tax=Lasiosphaeria ovina TaxID=92902 RepID=A0AAE0KE63_9PEZI|nr:GMC oxidoreductase-like protein [Lasiosphaeria ovina]
MLTARSCAALVWSLTLTLVDGGNPKRLPSIIGGGTAGLTIASRLAPHASVAVIEAGGFYEVDNGNKSIVPFYAFTQPFLGVSTYVKNPLMDWDLLTVPQSGANDRIIHYAQAKTLGGCSAHSTLAYLRGTKGSQDRWTEVSCTLSPPNWQKRKTPNATFEYDMSAFETGKKSGPVHVSWANYVDPSAPWLARALQTTGVPMSSLGLNSGTHSGFGAWSTTMIDPQSATRSSATEYLHDAIQDTSIMVYHRTQALKINFDPATKTATSVRVSTLGLEYTLAAAKEIILSAGVFHTPQLLIVSGIGPASTLQRHSIPAVAALPGVGQSLQDQISISVSSGLNTPSASTLINDPAAFPAVLDEYLASRSGPLSSAGGYLSFEKLPAPFRTSLSNATLSALAALPQDFPELEYIVAAFPSSDPSKIPTIGAVSATLLHPFSRGTVTLASGSMADAPVIDLGWLTHPTDQDLLVASVKRLRQFWNATALQPVKTGDGEIAPGANITADNDILAWEGDPMAVVDAQGRVLGGVQKLRVVDASVLPFALPAHPTATLYALAEKIADDILRGLR